MEKSQNKLSKHARKRLKERSSKSKRQSDLALSRGKPISEFTGSFRRYLDKIRLSKPFRVNILVYGDDIFIYSDKNALITVFDIPTKYNKCLRRRNM